MKYYCFRVSFSGFLHYHYSIGATTAVLKVAGHIFAVVSGNSRDGACFKPDKQTWWQKSNGTQKTISQNLLSKIL